MTLSIEAECEVRAGKLEFDDFGFVVATPTASWLCLCPTSGSGFETVSASFSRTIRAGLELGLERWAYSEWGPEVVERIRLDVLSLLPAVGDEATTWPLIACFQQAGFGFAFAGPYTVSVLDGQAWRALATAQWRIIGDSANPVHAWVSSGVGPGYESARFTTTNVSLATATQIRVDCGARSLPNRPDNRLVGGWGARLLLEWSRQEAV